MQQQYGANVRVNPNVNLEQHPQFQEEWRHVLVQLEQQYINHLNEYRKELIEIA
jgi:hypothetical protein